MSEFWWAMVVLASGAAGGAIIGYHAGLKRSSDALWEICKDIATGEPVREATIKECIEAVIAIRSVETLHNSACPQDWQWIGGRTKGVDESLEALRRMDKRGAGQYGVPRNIVELRSRIALAKAADED